ncbi:MAG: hypothetical protein KJ970_10070 [Candidatus Eisenbacteria bacterium]|uniref:Intracellular proteinase inhibitor BsuPI domain-containing protein n=1 Tax=Eiseniibacteriota bacterium TaxID=2212470 RepID=A0A948RUI7_UNCEI|nr:hypothetical protein [Candidatus Eisenbacteria bacterium]
MKAMLLGILMPLPVFAGSISVDGPLAYDVQSRPGQTHHGVIIIQNNSEEYQEIIAYQRDYLFYADGSNLYGEPGSEERSNGDWITFAPPQFTIQPEGSQPIAWTMTVPEGKDLRGSYWSLLMVEPIAHYSRQNPQNGELLLTSVVRYGIQLTTTVGVDGRYDLLFNSLDAVWGDSDARIQLDVENTGEVKLVPSVWVEIFNWDGVSQGRFQGGQKRIYPECSARFSVGIPKLPDGRYTALIVADNGDDHVFGSKLELQIE